MANVENLTNKILEDARQEADQMIADAERRASEIVDQKRRETEQECSRILRSAENEADRASERVFSNVRLQTRNEELMIRQEKMDEAFTKAKEMLQDMDDTAYKNYVTKVLEKLGTGQNEVVHVPQKRKAALGDQILGRKVEVSSDSTDGFSVQQDQVFLNFRFDALVESMREEMETEIRDILFSKEA